MVAPPGRREGVQRPPDLGRTRQGRAPARPRRRRRPSCHWPRSRRPSRPRCDLGRCPVRGRCRSGLPAPARARPDVAPAPRERPRRRHIPRRTAPEPRRAAARGSPPRGGSRRECRQAQASARRVGRPACPQRRAYRRHNACSCDEGLRRRRRRLQGSAPPQAGLRAAGIRSADSCLANKKRPAYFAR